MSAMSMSGLFYQVESPDVLIVDPDVPPTPDTQQQLRSEIEDFDELVANDRAYCSSVEGSAQESNLWVARNQDKTGLADADLQRFKSVAWNECVVKKFLNSKDGTADYVGQSMISIIQSLNLQWSKLHVMGLHPKIESAERQVIMSCMERALIPFDLDVGKVARAFRRCHHFQDFFANAVGGQIVANTGRTPGLSKTMYGTDMDYAYKNKAFYFFERALQRSAQLVEHCIKNDDSDDYVPRLVQLRVVRPDTGVELNNPTDETGGRSKTVVIQGGGSIGNSGSWTRDAERISRDMGTIQQKQADMVRDQHESVDRMRDVMENMQKSVIQHTERMIGYVENYETRWKDLDHRIMERMERWRPPDIESMRSQIEETVIFLHNFLDRALRKMDGIDLSQIQLDIQTLQELLTGINTHLLFSPTAAQQSHNGSRHVPIQNSAGHAQRRIMPSSSGTSIRQHPQSRSRSQSPEPLPAQHSRSRSPEYSPAQRVPDAAQSALPVPANPVSRMGIRELRATRDFQGPPHIQGLDVAAPRPSSSRPVPRNNPAVDNPDEIMEDLIRTVHAHP